MKHARPAPRLRYSLHLTLILLGWCWFNTSIVSAQTPDFRFANLSTSQGLPHVYVFGITQDHDGFMWFATQNGLARYDGVRFKTIYQSKYGLPGNSISCLTVSKSGLVWIGTWGSGLASLDPRTEQFVQYPFLENNTGLSGQFVQVIFEDSHGIIWVGTRRHGLNRLDPLTGSITYFSLPPTKPRDSGTRIWDICEAADGHLWIGTSAGLVSFHPGTGAYEYIDAAPDGPLSNDRVLALTLDPLQNLWIGTVNGLNKRAPDGTITQFFDKSDPSAPALANHFRDVLMDEDGQLWLALYSNGLKKFDPQTQVFQHFKSQTRQKWRLSNSQLECLFLDKAGTLWVGGRSAGVDRLDLKAQPFLHYQRKEDDPNSLSCNDVNCFAVQNEDEIWIGTEGGGLNRLDRKSKQFTVFRHEEGVSGTLSSDLVGALHVGSGSKLWIGTMDGVLQYLQEPENRFVPLGKLEDANNAGGNRIWSILQDDDSLLVGSNTGLARISAEDPVFKRIPLHQNEPHFHPVYAVIKDSRKNFWAASQTGLYQLTNKTFGDPVRFGLDRRDEMIVYNVCEDFKGRIWAATAEGLWRLDAPNQLAKSISNLETQAVYGVFDCGSDHLWINTESLLFRYHPQLDLLSGFSEEDGLQSSNFNLRASLAYRHEVFLGGGNGFNWFRSEEIRDHRAIPEVKVISVQTDKGEVSHQQGYYPNNSEIRLPFVENSLRISFAALDFVHQDRCAYRFQMEGWDNNWRRTELDRETFYSHLAPGNYVFKLQVANYDGIWAEPGTQLFITIVPPFYRTTQFYVLAGLLPFLIVWWWAVRKQRMERYLASIVEDQTRSLRDANQLLQKNAEDLRRTQAELTESAHRAGMAEVASDVLHNIGNALTSLQVSTSLVETKVNAIRLDFLKNLLALLQAQSHRLPEFFAEKRGKLVPQAIQMVTAHTEVTRNELLEEVQNLHHQVFHINEIVISQREYTTAGSFFELIDVKAMIEDVIRFQIAKMDEFHIKIERDFVEQTQVQGAKSVLLHIFNHLIRNAVESLSESDRSNRILSLRIRRTVSGDVELWICDNGLGIELTNLTAIFSPHWQGKKQHRRGNLHYCANAISGMGGSLKASSEGPGYGALFVLRIPQNPINREQDAPSHMIGY